MALQITSGIRSLASNVMAMYKMGGDYSKQMPRMWPEWVDGVPQWRMTNWEAYTAEGWGSNSLIYASVMFKAKAVSQAPLRAYEGDSDNPKRLPIKHPLAQLIARPNLYQSQSMFMALNETFLNVTGNAFILLDRPAHGALPTAMYPVNPANLEIIPKDGRVIGYWYVPTGHSRENGTPILLDDIMHIKLPNPNDPLQGQGWGFSPISPMAKNTDSDNRVTTYIYNLFKRGLMLGGIMQYKTPVSDEILARIQQRFRDIYGGSEKWADTVGVIDNGGEYKSIAPTFDQLGFGAIDERSETRILSPFGVPPILIGSRIGLMRSTYANYKEARTACWQDTLTYEIQLFSDDFEWHLSRSDEQTFVRADYSQVPALQKDVNTLIDGAVKLWQIGVPSRIAFDTVGLQIEEYEGIDDRYLPMGVQNPDEEPEPVPAPLADAINPVSGNDGTVTQDDTNEAIDEAADNPPQPKKPQTPPKSRLSDKKKVERATQAMRWFRS